MADHEDIHDTVVRCCLFVQTVLLVIGGQGITGIVFLYFGMPLWWRHTDSTGRAFWDEINEQYKKGRNANIETNYFLSFFLWKTIVLVRDIFGVPVEFYPRVCFSVCTAVHTVFTKINAPGAYFFRSKKKVIYRFHVLPPLKKSLIGFVYSPLWKNTHQFHVLPPLKNQSSVLCTPPFEKNTHRFCVLPPLKNHCFWWTLISGGRCLSEQSKAQQNRFLWRKKSFLKKAKMCS